MTGRHLFKRRNFLDTWRHVEVRRDSDLKKGIVTSATVGFCTRCGAEKFLDPGESASWICECGSILKYHFCQPYEYAFLHLKFEQGSNEYVGQDELDDLGLKGWEAYSITPINTASPDNSVDVIVALRRLYPLLHDLG